MELDLDIDNYELNDIIDLFRIPICFTEADMKRAKQMVLKTHPDKSKLDPSYFLFYSKAYKVLHTIYEFRNKNSKKMNVDEEYVPLNEDDGNEGKQKALDQFFKKNKNLTDSDNFNVWFNKQFEKNKIVNEADENGYGDWLKSDENIDPEIHLSSMSAMGEEFGKKKTQVRSLVVRKDITDTYYNRTINSSSLTGEAPEEYSSGLFSGLAYQDLRQAHVESVIPVTDEDYNNVQKFKNVNEYMSFRNTQDVTPLSEKQALDYLNKRNNMEDELASKRAYELAKQTEYAKSRTKNFWGGIMKIKN